MNNQNPYHRSAEGYNDPVNPIFQQLLLLSPRQLLFSLLLLFIIGCGFIVILRSAFPARPRAVVQRKLTSEEKAREEEAAELLLFYIMFDDEINGRKSR